VSLGILDHHLGEDWALAPAFPASLKDSGPSFFFLEYLRFRMSPRGLFPTYRNSFLIPTLVPVLRDFFLRQRTRLVFLPVSDGGFLTHPNPSRKTPHMLLLPDTSKSFFPPSSSHNPAPRIPGYPPPSAVLFSYDVHPNPSFTSGRASLFCGPPGLPLSTFLDDGFVSPFFFVVIWETLLPGCIYRAFFYSTYCPYFPLSPSGPRILVLRLPWISF